MHNAQRCGVILKPDWHQNDDQNIFDDFQVLFFILAYICGLKCLDQEDTTF